MGKHRGWGLVAVLVAAGMTTTAWAQKAATPAKTPPAKPAAKVVAPAADPADGDVMAIVDGVALPMSDLIDILVFSYGLPMAQQLVANELVRQEAVRHNVAVGPVEIAAEHQQMLRMLFPMFPDQAQREHAFGVYMQEGQVTQKQWDLTMERNAVLRQLAKGRVTVTDEILQHAFGVRYNRQVVVRHIQTANLPDAESVMKDLKGGVEFEKLVQLRSLSPSRQRDGLLDPISAQSPGTPPALREAALGLKEIGQLSNVIQAGTTYHILRLEQIIEPDKVKFEDVRDSLHKDVFEEMVQHQQLEVLRELIQRATEQKKIRYVHPILAEQDRQANTAAQPAP